MNVLAVAGIAFGAVLSACVAYRWVFAAAYLWRGAGLTSAPPAHAAPRFAVVIPAHDEERLISTSIRSVRAADYPQGRIEVVVVADNCGDATGRIARESGAFVYERNDPARRGKGQALRWVFERLDLDAHDAVAVLDADCLLSGNFFTAMSREIEAGARVLQAYDGIANPDETPLTRLVAVTNVMKNLLYNAGKCVLGFSPLLMGTGMVFRSAVLKREGWQAESIGEDLEQTFPLLRAGERVRFVPDARVFAQEAASFGQAFGQRQRWASARSALGSVGRRAVWDGLRSRNFVLAEAGLGLLMPTYSMLMNWTLALLLLTLPLVRSMPYIPMLPALLVALQAVEFGVGLWLGGADRRMISSIAVAPMFLVWKAFVDALAALGYRRRAWSRTRRHRNL